MKTSAVYAAIAGINEDLLDASENTEKVALSFRRQKSKRTAALLSAGLCSALAVSGVLSLPARSPTPEPAESIIYQTPGGETNEGRALLYTDLTVGHHGIEMRTGPAMACFAPFSEDFLKKVHLIIEGTVLETHVKKYHIVAEADGKFEAAGGKMTITMEPESFITTIRIEKIWKGSEDVSVGDTIVIEDEIFSTAGTCSYHEGTVCLFHLSKTPGDSLIYSALGSGETLIEGDDRRDSRWYNSFAHQPAIEKTAGGDYIVPAVWETVAEDSDEDVALLPEDIPGAEPDELYWISGGFKLVPSDVFSERMSALIRRIG